MMDLLVGRVAVGATLIFAVVLLFRGPDVALAQTYFGTIVGVVTDPSGADVPGATITVTNAATGISRESTSDQYGNYRVGSLVPGTYNIRAVKAGFEISEIASVILRVTETATVNIVLRIGKETQTVAVTAAPALLNTTNSTVGTVIENKEVVALPLNGRSYTDLVLLTPGSVPRSKLFAVAGGHNYAVSGNNPDQAVWDIDGLQNDDIFFKSFAQQPSVDAIQEFRVQTNTTSAEYSGQTNVNVALKSGTNHLHGSVYEFLRNDKFDASEFFANYFSTPQNPSVKPYLRQNQFGFAVGGPVFIPKVYNGRDKFFWFVNYEGFRIRRESTVVGTVPTITELSGDLRDLPPVYDPTTTRIDPVTGKLIRDQIQCNGLMNVICPGRIDPAMQAYANIFYKYTDKPGAGNILNTTPYRLDTSQVNIRGDYKISDKLSVFARYSPEHATELLPESLPVNQQTTVESFPAGQASWTFVPSPTMVIDFTAGITRTNMIQAGNNPAPGAAAFMAQHPLQGVTIHNATYPLFPSISLANYSSPFQSGTLSVGNDFQYILNVSKVKGRNTFKAGFSIDHITGLSDNVNETQIAFTSLATADPQNVGSTGSSVASFLLGLPASGSRRLGNTAMYFRQNWYEIYGQDEIRMTKRLTFTVGLRYQYDQYPSEKYGHLSTFDRGCRCFVWAGPNPLTGQGPNARPTVRDPDWNNFAPRVGLAYQFTPKTVFRAGYGIFYARNYLWEDQGMRGQWPYALIQSITGDNTPGATLTPVETFFSPDLNVTAGTPPSAQWVPNLRDRFGYTQNWNAGIQRQLTNSLLLEVDYVASKGTKMPSFLFGNLPAPGPGVIGSPQHSRPYPEDNLTMILGENRDSSIYHSLQTKLTKRFSSGLTFNASYAYGHYIDIGGAGNSTESFPQGGDRMFGADRGNGIYDFRHIFTVGYDYQLPFGRGKKYLAGINGVANQLLGGWELSGITSYRSGGPVTVNLTFDNANTGDVTERPNLILGQPARMIDPNDKTQGWLNPANFAVPTQYTYGNLGRNTFRGPGLGYWDIGAFKDFPLPGENHMLQFRSEFFNAFNNVSLGDPNNGFCEPIATCNPSFGRIFGTQTSAREIQFALKLLF